jgi:hypothetical protein
MSQENSTENTSQHNNLNLLYQPAIMYEPDMLFDDDYTEDDINWQFPLEEPHRQPKMTLDEIYSYWQEEFAKETISYNIVDSLCHSIDEDDNDISFTGSEESQLERK